MLGKSLQDGARDHDDRTNKDGHASAIALVQPWGDRNSEDGTKLVAGRHETNNIRVDGRLIILVLVAIAKVYVS